MKRQISVGQIISAEKIIVMVLEKVSEKKTGRSETGYVVRVNV
jgi:hypothetical protein